jgi:hypothetical protein
MALQPNHRATHVPTYILPGDSAWNTEKINYEMDILSGVAEPAEGEVYPWTTREDHPVVRFRNGASRFDIETIKDYLLPGEKPTYVVLRRATLGQWQSLQSLMEREVVKDGQVLGRTETLIAAIRFSFEACDDLGLKAPRGGLTDTQIETLREQVGDECFILLAYACLAVNRSLSPIESFFR